ncbi:MAG TPA: Hpt domain-containing protein [Terriglobales bacterium]|nr:Hpt domain-containing protein [Terriglobales bacterium]
MGPNITAPDITGIDTELGLKSVGGKLERYESLLRKFAQRQGGTVEAIRGALLVGDVSTAEREAHSLRGAASTLGATALAKHAADVEIAIQTEQNVDQAIESLSHCLLTVVKAIRAAFPG